MYNVNLKMFDLTWEENLMAFGIEMDESVLEM